MGSGRRRGVSRRAAGCVRIDAWKLTWYGRTCIRLRGKDAVVVADPYPAIVGPTGRGITGEIVTFSHPDDKPLPKAKGRLSRDGRTAMPTSLEEAFVLDGPGEYEVRDVLITGVRTYRDDQRGVERGSQTAFVIEIDGMHTIHLGDIGHLLTEEKLGDIGSVDVACVPVGGALSATRRRNSSRSSIRGSSCRCPCARKRPNARRPGQFFHEVGAAAGVAMAKLSVTPPACPSRRRASCWSHAARPRTASAARVVPGYALQDDAAALHHRADEVGAGPIRDLARRRHVPDHEIGLFAGLDRSDLVAETQRVGGVDGHGGQRLRRCQP